MEYFEELDPDDLNRHFVPLDPELRTVERYPDFVAARRTALANAMNDLLDGYRPAMLDEVVTTGHDADEAATLSIQAYGSSEDAGDVLLLFTATRGAEVWRDTATMASIAGALDDLADGRGTELIIGGAAIDLPAETTELVLPVGPVLVSGAPGEWRKVLDRELDDLLPGDEMPDVQTPPEYDGQRVSLSILDSD